MYQAIAILNSILQLFWGKKKTETFWYVKFCSILFPWMMSNIGFVCNADFQVQFKLLIFNFLNLNPNKKLSLSIIVEGFPCVIIA
jgi:hypothetical protein